MSLVERVKAKVADARDRWPLVDHAVRMQEHYSAVQGSQQAGGVTYFGFLSVFPILALAFFAVGYIADVFPDANESLEKAINEVLPGLVGGGDGQVDIADVQNAAGTVGLIGLLGVLYAGLGWLSSLQSALVVIFELPARLRPNFVIGKVRDLVSLAVLGVVLLSSVGLSAVLTRTSRAVLDVLHVGAELGWLVTLVALALGLAASALLFFLMFRLLARPPLPSRALWSGAWLGAIGFEVLKQLSGLLLTGTRGQPAFQAFGIALILLVWINYFSRVVLYAAAWAQTSPLAERPPAPAPAAAAIAAASTPRPGGVGEPAPPAPPLPRLASFVAGGALGVLLTLLGRRRRP
ncbi:YihY/virulence factor BrkB family protein [Pimelobacter sp. 30-1]|uniref:YihY/virulence factor BrkB family protein n=1 Tax=Pimelobacter sp. 30-1 TaxID=2004991 RepID=UPI00207BCCD2|nr:YihY/virulence factor BrkB family protein [Pimelobacter sp. 30-1]